MRIFLRPITENDGKKIVKWRNAPQVASHCFNRIPVTEESNRAFYRTHVETGHYKQYIVERVDEDFGVASYAIATVYLKDMDVINHRCELCIFTSDDEEWNTESQSIAIKLLLDKAFNEFGMHKVYSYVFSEFQDEIELLKRTGFEEEAILRKEALSVGGDYVDAYRMTIFAENLVNEGE